jgi:hypothetical protein
MHFVYDGSSSKPAVKVTHMHTSPFLGSLALLLLAPASALGQDRTWEWQWGMHPMLFMWGAGALVMRVMMLVFWGFVIAGLVLGAR